MSLTFIIRKVSSVYNGLSEEKWKEVHRTKCLEETRELASIASITKIINNRNSESSLIAWAVFLHFPNQTSLICSPELVVLVPNWAPAARYPH